MSKFNLTGVNKDIFAIYFRHLIGQLPFPMVRPLDENGTRIRLEFPKKPCGAFVTEEDVAKCLTGASGSCYESIISWCVKAIRNLHLRLATFLGESSYSTFLRCKCSFIMTQKPTVLTVPVHCAATFLARAYSLSLPEGTPLPRIAMSKGVNKIAGEGSVTLYHPLSLRDMDAIRTHLQDQNSQ